MNKSKNLIFFGTEDFSAYALEALLAGGWDVVAVVTKPDSRSGRGRQFKSPAVLPVTQKHSIDVFQPESLKGFESTLKKYSCSVAVLSAYGKIIPSEILKLFELGIVNIHPSLLPKHRGASPIEQTILSGSKVAGVSLMKLVEEMDAGPVFSQVELNLNGRETATELYESLGKLGAKLLLEKLPSVTAGKLQATTQNHSLATYTPLIKKTDGIINWDDSASVIERQIRAYQRWPGSKTLLVNKPVTITQARLLGKSGKAGEVFTLGTEIGVYGKDMSIIIEKLKPDGKREMTSQEFLAGNKLSFL